MYGHGIMECQGDMRMTLRELRSKAYKDGADVIRLEKDLANMKSTMDGCSKVCSTP